MCVIPTSEGRPSSHIGKSGTVFPHSAFRLYPVFTYNILSRVTYTPDIYKDIKKKRREEIVLIKGVIFGLYLPNSILSRFYRSSLFVLFILLSFVKY